jgi:hypothetical protein
VNAAVHVIDPLVDRRWDDLVAQHPHASVFHSRGWLQALHRTYGYDPFVLTTTRSGPLSNGMVACRIRSWVTRRFVSLPFSDHCEPLVDQPESLDALVDHVRDGVRRGLWGSVEVRPRTTTHAGLAAGGRYWLHTLDLTRPEAQLFDAFHPSHTRRAIRRAEREGLQHECGNSDRLLSMFYAVLRLSRRRHGLPPQPLAWFRHLVESFGDRLAIHVATREHQPVAGLLTLTFRDTVTYKYGGSDARWHALGGMPFLFWQVVLDAQRRGLHVLDLGRSDLDQPGLIAFKDHLGAVREPLTYACDQPHRGRRGSGPLARVARRLLRHLPDRALDAAGRLIYGRLG